MIRGLYRLQGSEPADRSGAMILASGPVVREALRARTLLAEDFGLPVSVWSVTSWSELYRDAIECSRWSHPHPGSERRKPWIERMLGSEPGIVVAVTDYTAALPASLARWLGPDSITLGTDGFGRSGSRQELRRFFEIDAENIAFAALAAAQGAGEFEAVDLVQALRELGLRPDQVHPMKR